MLKRKNNEKGFTIIEVVLVLAIAGLIFLVVFLALPALQRSQRDTARKNDVGIVASAINSYSSNNKGALPDSVTKIDGYLDGLSNNVSTKVVKVAPSAGTSYASLGANKDTVVIATKAVCGTDDKLGSGATARQAAVIMQLESSSAYYCQDV